MILENSYIQATWRSSDWWHSYSQQVALTLQQNEAIVSSVALCASSLGSWAETLANLFNHFPSVHSFSSESLAKQHKPLISAIPEHLLLPETIPATSTHSRSQYAQSYFPEGWPLHTHGLFHSALRIDLSRWALPAPWLPHWPQLWPAVIFDRHIPDPDCFSHNTRWESLKAGDDIMAKCRNESLFWFEMWCFESTTQSHVSLFQQNPSHAWDQLCLLCLLKEKWFCSPFHAARYYITEKLLAHFVQY